MPTQVVCATTSSAGSGVAFGAPAGAASAERVAGLPSSANGASSHHAWLGEVRMGTEASVVLTVTTPPKTKHLYFRAMQVGFHDADGRHVAGATRGSSSIPATRVPRR